MSEQIREDEEQDKQVPNYAKRYADKFFELKEKSLREYSTDRELGLGLPLVISAIVVIIAGIVYGVAFRTTFLSFGIFCLICLLGLLFHTVGTFKLPNGREGNEAFLIHNSGGSSRVSAWRFEKEHLAAFGANSCNQTVVDYLRSVMRDKGKKERRGILLSLIAPLLAFVVGMIAISLGVEFLSIIIFVISVFITLCLQRYFYSVLWRDVYPIINIRGYACPQCHMVDRYSARQIDSKTYDFDHKIKSKTGERMVGTVYSKGQKIGTVSESYVTNTYQKGTRHLYTTLYTCMHCGRKFTKESGYNTNVETYTI